MTNLQIIQHCDVGVATPDRDDFLHTSEASYLVTGSLVHMNAVNYKAGKVMQCSLFWLSGSGYRERGGNQGTPALGDLARPLSRKVGRKCLWPVAYPRLSQALAE